MKRLSKAILLSLVALLVASMPVLAAVAYRAAYTIVESGGTAYDMLPTSVLVDNQWLADNGFLQDDALDTRIETLGGLIKPHMVATNKTLTSVPVPADSQTNLYFTTANSDLSSLDIITGYDGYITVDDDATLELGTDFEIELDAYVDTSDSNFTFPMQKRVATSIAITDTSEISGIIYFDEPVDVSPGAGDVGGWTDIDITEYVPAYATGAVVHLYTSNQPEIIGVRMNGVALDMRGDIGGHIWGLVGIDANDIFEGWIEAVTCHIYLVGFTGSGVTYNVAPDDISIGALAWTPIDLSALAPDAIGAIVAIDRTIAGADAYGLRMNGSADARIDTIFGDGWFYGIIGCDAAQVIEGYVGAVTTDFYLVGYITEDFTFNLNATETSFVGGFAAWNPMDLSNYVPAGTTHIIFEVVAPGGLSYGFQRNDSAENIVAPTQTHSWVIVECDSDYIVEHWANNANLDVFIVGYTQGYIDDPYQKVATATGIASGEYTVKTSLNSTSYDFTDYSANTTIAVSMGGGFIPVFLLEEQELTAPATSVTFSNIDTLVADWDTYAGVTSRHLVLVVNAATSTVAAREDIYLRFNGDTGNNYNYQTLRGLNNVGSATVATGGTFFSAGPIPGTTYADSFGGLTIILPHAFNTTNHKSVLTIGGAVEDVVRTATSRWADVSAIDTVLLYLSAGNLITGSTFWLGVVDERYLVEEATPNGAAVDFNGIEGDGYDLVMIGYTRSTTAAVAVNVEHRMNGDGAANYFRQYIRGTGAFPTAAAANDRIIGIGSGSTATANAFGALVAFCSQYAESTNQVHYSSISGMHESGGPNSHIFVISGRWANVAAITRWELTTVFADGSLFSLYRVPRTVIDRQELTAPVATITFADIPQGYEALQLNIYTQSDDVGATDTVLVSYNNNVVAADYDTQYLRGVAGVVAALRDPADRILMEVPAAAAGANIWGGGIVTIPNYAKADRHKHYTNISGAAEASVYLWSSRWESLNPITEIDLTLTSTDNFDTGSVFELVGIFPQDVFAIEVDGDLYDIEDGNNVTVPDNANDWILNQNNVMPYMDYYKHTVSGVEHAWYQPNYMVEATDYDGTETAGGSAVTVTDNTMTDAPGYWVNALVTITEAGGAAPEGESRVCTVFAAGGVITVAPAFSANVDIGDDFTIDFGTLIDRSYYGLEFDGTNDRVDCGVDSSLSPAKITIMAWVKTSRASQDVVHRYIAAGNQRAYDLFIDGTVINLVVDADGFAGGDVVITGGTVVNGDVWTFVVATSDGVNLNLYVNGAIDAAPVAFANDIHLSTGTLYIGDGVYTGIDYLGNMDEVWIYNRALGLAEIQANYNAGVGTYTPYSTSGLVGQWHMEEGSGGTTADSSGEGNTGTLQGNTAWINGYVPRPAGNSGTNDSRITWGANPTGVSVALGGMVSEGQPVLGALPEDPAQDILPETEVTDWFIEPDVGGTLLTNPLRPFVTMWSDNSTLTELQCWRIYALALILLITVATAMAVGHHQGITMIMAGVAILGAVVMTIFPMWSLVFAIGMFIGGLVMERSPSL